MTEWDPEAFENALIDDMRAHGGAVTTGPLAGHPLLVMFSKGAKSGERRRAILIFTRDGGDYVVAGTASGAPTAPAWVQNVRQDSSVEVEAENRTFKATARVVNDDERDRLWKQHVEALPHFADYPEKAGRVIPMVRPTAPSASMLMAMRRATLAWLVLRARDVGGRSVPAQGRRPAAG